MPRTSHSGASLKPINNLNDLLNAATARANLGLGSVSTHAANEFAVAVHTHAITDVTGLSSALSNLASLTDTRFPTSGQKAALAGTTGTPGSGNKYVTNDDSRLNDSRTPLSHSHVVADLPVADDGVVSSSQIVRANDLRLSNARTPTTHSHTIATLPVAADGEVSSTKLVRSDDVRLTAIQSIAGTTLDAGKIYLGDADNEAAEVVLSQDATIATDGKVTVHGILAKTITRFVSGSASLNFGTLADGDTTTANIVVTGAHVGDFVVLGLPNSVIAGVTFIGYASADRVTVKAVNTSGDPVAVGTITVNALAIGVS